MRKYNYICFHLNFIIQIKHLIKCISRILTDGWQSYKTLPDEGFLWDFVNHSENVVKPGDRTVHTNRIKGASVLYQLKPIKNHV